MPAALDSAVEPKSVGSPSSRNSPPSRRCTPATTLTSVDLPAPFSPTSPWIEPASARSEPDRRATTEPKDFVTSRSSSAAAGSVICPPWSWIERFQLDVEKVGDRDHLCQGRERDGAESRRGTCSSAEGLAFVDVSHHSDGRAM